jgi:hypothetical protein
VTEDQPVPDRGHYGSSPAVDLYALWAEPALVDHLIVVAPLDLMVVLVHRALVEHDIVAVEPAG